MSNRRAGLIADSFPVVLFASSTSFFISASSNAFLVFSWKADGIMTCQMPAQPFWPKSNRSRQLVSSSSMVLDALHGWLRRLMNISINLSPDSDPSRYWHYHGVHSLRYDQRR